MTDSQKLRAWMAETFHGLREDRSTESYALEFLITGQRNLIAAHARIDFQLAVQALAGAADRVNQALDRIKGLEREEEE